MTDSQSVIGGRERRTTRDSDGPMEALRDAQQAILNRPMEALRDAQQGGSVRLIWATEGAQQAILKGPIEAFRGAQQAIQ